jgi:hypothetical protein
MYRLTPPVMQPCVTFDMGIQAGLMDDKGLSLSLSLQQVHSMEDQSS